MPAMVSETAAWKIRERWVKHGITPKRDAPYNKLKGEWIASAHRGKYVAVLLGEDLEIVETWEP